jgi:hypothetical protein
MLAMTMEGVYPAGELDALTLHSSSCRTLHLSLEDAAVSMKRCEGFSACVVGVRAGPGWKKPSQAGENKI